MFEVNLNLNLSAVAKQLAEAKKSIESSVVKPLRTKAETEAAINLIKDYKPIKILDSTKPLK
jgi:hypothetical protein